LFTSDFTKNWTVKNISLDIMAGEQIALVGPSGAGKSTLVDVMLGVLNVEQGSAWIFGITPRELFKKHSDYVSYVPQSIYLIQSSIRDNLLLGRNHSEVTNSELLDVLSQVGLKEFVLGLENGLETILGEGGLTLSGGQKQRIGIARALVNKPKLLILDEVTSALDALTEESISETLENLRGETCVIIIAHRLSTVKRADKVIYMESGEVKAIGPFDDLRKIVPNFEKQAKLMGL
jgi:ATP-binding cassette subfamily C protein